MTRERIVRASAELRHLGNGHAALSAMPSPGGCRHSDMPRLRVFAGQGGRSMRRTVVRKWPIALAVTAAVLIAGMLPADAAFEEAKLIAEDPQGSALFGLSVDIDGSTAIVGEPLDLSGSAYVFVRSDHAWSQQAKLVHTGISGGDNFGDAVAIEGDTAVVGAPRWDVDPDADHARGAAYVFTRSGSTWTQQAQLLSSDLSEFDRFGASVALDGDTMVIGAPGESGQFFAEGAAYVFARSGNAWVEQAKLKAADPQDTDVFGVSVAVDGDTVIVGSRSATPSTSAARALRTSSRGPVPHGRSKLCSSQATRP